MSFTVLQPGLYTLPVGVGRPDLRAFGIPLGGPADRASFLLANGLVGNEPMTPGLELTLSGPTLRAETQITAVVFGAPFEVFRNTTPFEPGTTYSFEPGDILRIGGTPTGCRAYLCVPGGFCMSKAPEPIKVGDVLKCHPSTMPARSLGFVTPDRGPPGELRVLPGPQRDWFPDDSFFTRRFTVSPASNRMGVRLTGEPIPKRSGELVSEAVAPGAVQITNDGLPIVLGVDGQTIGGYPKIAHVIRADLDTLGQLRPGDTVQFVEVAEDTADAAARERAEFLQVWLTRLSVTSSGNNLARLG